MITRGALLYTRFFTVHVTHFPKNIPTPRSKLSRQRDIRNHRGNYIRDTEFDYRSHSAVSPNFSKTRSYPNNFPAQLVHYKGTAARPHVHTRKNDSHSPGRAPIAWSSRWPSPPCRQTHLTSCNPLIHDDRVPMVVSQPIPAKLVCTFLRPQNDAHAHEKLPCGDLFV